MTQWGDVSDLPTIEEMSRFMKDWSKPSFPERLQHFVRRLLRAAGIVFGTLALGAWIAMFTFFVLWSSGVD